jgi:hypothetical protein
MMVSGLNKKTAILLLQNPKVHRRVYKGTSIDPILNQLKPQSVTVKLFKFHFNIILPTMPMVFKKSKQKFCMRFLFSPSVHLKLLD